MNRKLNAILSALALSAISLSAMAEGGSRTTLPSLGSTVNFCATTNASASGATTTTYGQTIARLVNTGPVGTTTTQVNVLAQGGGTGKSATGTSALFSETDFSGRGNTYVAGKGSMTAWSIGNDSKNMVGGDMMATNVSGATTNFSSAHGFGATGAGTIEGGSSGTYTYRVGMTKPLPVILVPVSPTCSVVNQAGGC